MEGFKFRFIVYFWDGSKYIDGAIYTDRHECCLAAAEMTRKLREWRPVRRWSYRGWAEGDPEPV